MIISTFDLVKEALARVRARLIVAKLFKTKCAALIVNQTGNFKKSTLNLLSF